MMLKQMWQDITEGWGAWRDWGLGFALICILFTAGLFVFGVPAFLLWYFFNLSPDVSVPIIAVILFLGSWAYDAHERSQ